jgi:hypothetical protein
LEFAAAASIQTKIVSGNANGVTIKIGSIKRREPEAAKMAAEHCQKFGKSPQELSRSDTGTATTIVYSCVTS